MLSIIGIGHELVRQRGIGKVKHSGLVGTGRVEQRWLGDHASSVPQ